MGKTIGNDKDEGNCFPPLVVESLFKSYGKASDFAVRDVSFECRDGEILGILGENGAGKSTTLKCITGMIPFQKGSVKISGFDIVKQPMRAKRNFSFVTDNHSVFVKMTGRQYLAFCADIYGVDKNLRSDRVEFLESVFKLGDSVDKLILSYSHGMKQKICMMGSLIHEPRLWILDEPMVGLDPRTQNAVTEFMRSWAKAGKSILFSSHNLDVVRRICDRVVIIKNGELIADILIDDEIRNNPDILNSYYTVQQSPIEASEE